MGPSTAAPIVAGIRISHPERVIYPELGLTKLALATYAAAVGNWMLPHVRGRPLTLVHCPAGVGGECHYMKHSRVWGPAELRRVRIPEKTKVGEYLVADTVSAIVALMQMGVVEIHTWNTTIDRVEHPNRIVWDLDPGPEVTWREVVKAARLLRGILDTLGLRAWVKTTGGRGLHVVVPLAPERDWLECLAFARDVATAVARAAPDTYTIALARAGREDKILIDYLRNNRTNTSVAAFSPRARPGAPVSVPLAWEELTRPPDRFTVLTVPRRLQRLGADPWARYWTAHQSISADVMAAVRRLGG